MQTRKGLTSCILEWKMLSEMRDKRATGDDDVAGDIFRLLGEDSIKIMTQLISRYMKLANGPRLSELQ